MIGLPSHESVLAQITERPTRFQEFARSRSENSKRLQAARAIVRCLKDEGLIRQQYLDGIPYLVLTDWKPDDSYWRLKIDERSRRNIDGCIEWLGAFNFHGNPVLRIEGRSFKTVRHWLLSKHRGKTIDTRRTSIHMTCCNDACIELTHMVTHQMNSQHKGKQRPLDTVIRMSIANQRKINRDGARAIRASSESSAVLALRYGVTRETINQIRRGATHKEVGIFTALLAA